MSKLTGTHIVIIACVCVAATAAAVITGKLELTPDLLKQVGEIVAAWLVGLHMDRPGYMGK